MIGFQNDEKVSRQPRSQDFSLPRVGQDFSLEMRLVSKGVQGHAPVRE